MLTILCDAETIIVLDDRQIAILETGLGKFYTAFH